MELINQTYFKNICKYSFDNEPNGFGTKTFKRNEDIDNNFIYVKTDYLEEFYNVRPNSPYILFTGRSDINIDSKYTYILDDPNLIQWYAVNVNLVHAKLESMPLGLMDSWWYDDGYSEYGNNKLILDYLNVEKISNVYMNFNVSTNVTQRQSCLDNAVKLGIFNMGNGFNTKSYSKYLDELSRCTFCLCPEGNGIDTHRLWESLYLKTVPIVTRSINVSFYEHLPIIIIDSWNDLHKEDLSFERYNKFNFTRWW